MIKLQLINADILSSGTPRTFPQVNKLGERPEDFRMDILYHTDCTTSQAG
jgi:hypothetical protein